MCTHPVRHRLPVSGDREVLLFLVQAGYLSHRKFYQLLSDGKGLIHRALPVPAKTYLQPRVISMAKWHIVGWHVLNP